jgi:hypothetical protein
MDFSLSGRKIDLLQRLDAGKGSGDISHLNAIVLAHTTSIIPYDNGLFGYCQEAIIFYE